MAVSALLPALQAHDATITPSLLSPMLTAMRRDGLIERLRHGHYQVATPRRRVPLVAPPAVGA